MTLLVDLFGYLTIVIHALTITAQSIALGGVFFLVFLVRPQAWLVGTAGDAIRRDTVRIVAWGTVALIVCECLTVGLESAVLIGTVDLPLSNVLGADFAIAGMVKIAAALVLLLLLLAGRRVPASLLLATAVVELAAATLTTHAAARIDDRPLLLAVEGLHQLGAAIWIGGIPCFISALARVHDGACWRVIGERFSRISMIGVLCIIVSGAAMSFYYIGSWDAAYGTAYGVMVGAKVAMFLGLLALGYGNFRTVARLRADPHTPVLRMKRFAEVEIGIGITIFFAAASLTSVPPAVDLTQDRVSWQEILDRNWPVLPRLASPDHDSLALPALQDKLDAEAAAQAKKPPAAYVPGSGDFPARNAADIAWSEYNHHWAGILVGAIGLLALLNKAGLRAARHWPLLFLVLAAFLFLRSDPEVWPLGKVPFWDSLRDVEVFQHRVFVVLIIIFGLFEWWVRARGQPTRLALVFPLVTAIGAAALFTHTHALSNLKDQLLIEFTHTPLALVGVAAGWSRWLELRLDPPGNRIAGWVWPVCFVVVGFMLINYREA